MTQPEVQHCPICQTNGAKLEVDSMSSEMRLNCLNCGRHPISRGALDDLPKMLRQDQRPIVAHGVYKTGRNSLLTGDLLMQLSKVGNLPAALERIDLLVRHLAEFGPRMVPTVHTLHLPAKVGAADPGESSWVLEQAMAMEYINCYNQSQFIEQRHYMSNVSLTARGWQRYEELMRNGAGSRHAFMAMDFKAPDIRGVLNNFMRTAVAKTGFDLRTTQGDHQTAGSIDNRMRVEIRTARFVICDLSHGNRGAYWEAGFAEGLGRPVFYTCRRDVLEAKDHPDGPHFDTRQQLIIPWDADDPAPAMEELKSTIRATLPAEAKMEDRPDD